MPFDSPLVVIVISRISVNPRSFELLDKYRRPYKEMEVAIGGEISENTNSIGEVKKLDNLRLQEEDEKLASALGVELAVILPPMLIHQSIYRL